MIGISPAIQLSFAALAVAVATGILFGRLAKISIPEEQKGY